MHQVLLAMRLSDVLDRAEGRATALEGLPEGGAELTIEVGVYQRVQRAVEVANPKDNHHDDRVVWTGAAE